MMSSDLLLPRTPSQHADESPLGYVLRLAEVNGYPYPSALAAHLGLTQFQLVSRSLDVAHLGALTGRPTEQFHAYRDGLAGGSALALMGHALPSSELRLSNPRLCPHCVREREYIPCWCDLSVVDGCPTHRVRLLEACTTCRKPLAWQRRGLLKCSCGAAVDKDWEVEALLPAHAALLAAVIARLERRSEADDILLDAIPGCGQSLATATQLIRALAALHSAATGSHSHNHAARRAAAILDRWPHNVSAALTTVLRNSAAGSAPSLPSASEVRMKWASRMGEGAAACMHEVLRGLPIPNADAAVADLEVVADDSPGRPEKPPKPTRRPRRPRYHDSGTVGVREASRLLGIPVSALQHLRTAGKVSFDTESGFSNRYRLTDIKDLEHRFQSLATGPAVKACAFTKPLSIVIKHLRLKSADGKGKLLQAVLEKQLDVVGRRGPKLTDLLLDKAQLDAYVEGARERVFGAMTPAEVGRVLRCDPLVATKLAKLGHLLSISTPSGKRILRSSVDEFSSYYVSLAQAAQEIGTRSRWLRQVAREVGMEVLEVARCNSESTQGFIRQSDAAGLRNAYFARKGKLRSAPHAELLESAAE
jgi:hypothetical protein